MHLILKVRMSDGAFSLSNFTSNVAAPSAVILMGEIPPISCKFIVFRGHNSVLVKIMGSASGSLNVISHLNFFTFIPLRRIEKQSSGIKTGR